MAKWYYGEVTEVHEGGAGTDPGWGHTPGHPSQGLPVGPGHVAPPIFHPGHPDHGLPSSPGHPGNRPPGSWGGPTDPGFGVGGGGGTLPEPPPGVWPPLTPEHPWRPIPPDAAAPPGSVWPPLPPGASGKYFVLVLISGIGYRYTVIDADLKPGHDLPSGGHPSGQPVPPLSPDHTPPGGTPPKPPSPTTPTPKA